MRSAQQMTITLPLEMANMMKSLVACGDYVSESEVIQEGLRALQERENAIEHWLGTEVAPAYDAYQANPTRAKPLSEAWKDIEVMMDDTDGEASCRDIAEGLNSGESENLDMATILAEAREKRKVAKKQTTDDA